MTPVRKLRALRTVLLVFAMMVTFAVAAYAAKICNGAPGWSAAGCEGHTGYINYFQSCTVSPGSACAMCWYNCQDGGQSKCAESDNGSVKNCFNLRYDADYPEDWWQY